MYKALHARYSSTGPEQTADIKSLQTALTQVHVALINYCHERFALVAVFESPNKTVTIKFYMVCFVDDLTGQVNDFLSDAKPTLDILVKKMAYDAQLCGLL
jgi:hypothetical protein